MKGAARNSAQGQQSEKDCGAVFLTSQVNLLLQKCRIINAPLVSSRTNITGYLATRLSPHSRTLRGLVTMNAMTLCDRSFACQRFSSSLRQPKFGPFERENVNVERNFWLKVVFIVFIVTATSLNTATQRPPAASDFSFSLC